MEAKGSNAEPGVVYETVYTAANLDKCDGIALVEVGEYTVVALCEQIHDCLLCSDRCLNLGVGEPCLVHQQKRRRVEGSDDPPTYVDARTLMEQRSLMSWESDVLNRAANRRAQAFEQSLQRPRDVAHPLAGLMKGLKQRGVDIERERAGIVQAVMLATRTQPPIVQRREMAKALAPIEERLQSERPARHAMIEAAVAKAFEDAECETMSADPLGGTTKDNHGRRRHEDEEDLDAEVPF